MDLLFQAVVMLAALLYISDNFKKRLAMDRTVQVELMLSELNKLHDTTFEEIKPSFELWWNEGSSAKVAAKLIDHIKQSPGVVNDPEVPDFVIELAASDMMRDVKAQAIHLATHTIIEPKAAPLLEKLERNKLGREMANEWNELHRLSVENSSSMLLEYGVDVEALQRHFANSVAN